MKNALQLLDGRKGKFIEPACSHARGECSGCPLMRLEYAEQLGLKKELLKELFGTDIEVEAAPERLGYRNRIDLTYSGGKLGYRVKGDAGSFELEKCLIAGDKTNNTVKIVQGLLKKLGIPSAAIMDRRPGLGYVVFRETVKGHLTVNLVFFGKADEKAGEICAALAESGCDSVNVLLNETWSDTAYGRMAQTCGWPFIEEEMLGMKFLVGPNTFFQTNVHSAEKIFTIVRDAIPDGSDVLDLYCGVGTISICIAEKCRKVTGVEISEESVLAAIKNAKLNGVENAQFIAAGIEEGMRVAGGGFDVVVLDPPRSGVQGKLPQEIASLGAKKIIYVSCNPATLARDIRLFTGYRVSVLRAFDQFPQTAHMEMLCVLEKNG